MARFDKLPKPPLTAIDEEGTAHTNEVLRAARERIFELDVTQKLTSADCVGSLLRRPQEWAAKGMPNAGAREADE